MRNSLQKCSKMRSLILTFTALAMVSHVLSETESPPKSNMKKIKNCIMNFPKYPTYDDLLACKVIINNNNKTMNRNCESFQCILKRNELSDGTKVNRQAFQTFMENHAPDEYKTFIKNAVTTCGAKVDAKPTDCEAKAFYMCFKLNLIKSLPDSAWRTTEECTMMKNKIKSQSQD